MSQSLSEIFQSNAAFVEDLFTRYQADARSVPLEWRHWFQGFQDGLGSAVTLLSQSLPSADRGAIPSAPIPVGTSVTLHEGVGASAAGLLVSLKNLAVTFETQGHLFAQNNPLHDAVAFPASVTGTPLDPQTHGILPEHFAHPLPASLAQGLCPLLGEAGAKIETISDFVHALGRVFCGSVGVECAHLLPEEKQWLQNELHTILQPAPQDIQQKMALELARADVLEKTIGAKFIGKKRFSIEGADAQIPALESLFDAACEQGAQEFTLGMAHRGRLNILVHVAGKPLEQLVAEFEGEPHGDLGGDGDVKYHNGFESQRNTRAGKAVRVALAFNPSHLEFVGSVVLGDARARQDQFHQGNRRAVLPVLLHGDAAVAGQGTVYESINMMSLQGYNVGGCVHIVANNQVGFTTNPCDSRSSTYCTDVAKVVGAPVFHVNSADLDSLHRVMGIAARFRQQFAKDVFVDLVCYRRHGHNEGDEPMFTQPLLYKKIKSLSSPFENYLKKLQQFGISESQIKFLRDQYSVMRDDYTARFDDAKRRGVRVAFAPWGRGWEGLRRGNEADILEPTHTAVSAPELEKIAQDLVHVPTGFKPNQKLARIVVQERQEMAQGLKPIDWGFAELLAYGSLLSQGYAVRLAGQDARRGTFAHRHAALVDEDTGDRFVALESVAQAHGTRFEVVDSLLSESAAMGYEYGYATSHAKALVIWEGQFGDFVNGAQVIVDQFLVSGETKWGRTQNLTLLLPHGYEGQGPEHSSGRLERFLQLSAQGNMQVCNLTSASQIFHVLRRQVVRGFRKPLVVMTPKSFLRNPRTLVDFKALCQGSFCTVLDDPRFLPSPSAAAALDPKKVKKVLLCTGKFSVDLLDAAEKEGSKNNIAIVRVEQLAPLDTVALKQVLARYPKAKWVWAQEEPLNMGAAWFMERRLSRLWHEWAAAGGVPGGSPASPTGPVGVIARSERASPSVGIEKHHHKEQAALLSACFDDSLGETLV